MSNRHPFAHPLFARVVGIDRLLSFADAALSQAVESSFPPFNIVKIDESGYKIELAVAGFEIADLGIETKERVLYVTGERKAAPPEEATFLHRGIANRSFKREFQLAEFVEVKGASVKNGILSIDLVREVPEAQKHRKIDIGVAAASAAAEESVG
ncbi:Hsp20 family protein [Pararhizobium sp. BT-229]|uniref:Hsp20 family protein n=1 Tax=Pararhizobium sp. BT-229 TaxID=2986923 RepID=UPI0021F6CAAB|nr:Hsp20 family protein [Pararhizobium sp. BT-229]MCV9964352.1 Hsp20 family protein [Pararhizobium sp. BT-229]